MLKLGRNRSKTAKKLDILDIKRNEKREKKAAPLHPSVKKRVEKKEKH